MKSGFYECPRPPRRHGNDYVCRCDAFLVLSHQVWTARAAISFTRSKVIPLCCSTAKG